jgi:hypothetical protein
VLGPQDLLVDLDDFVFAYRQGLSFDGDAVKQGSAVLADAPASDLLTTS